MAGSGALASHRPRLATDALGRALRGALVLAAGAIFALGLTYTVANNEPSAKIVVAGGIGLLVVLSLALWSESAAVGLGAVLLAFVRFEPAPTDAVFLIVIAVAAASGRLRIARAPLTILLLLGAFLTLNLTSATQAVNFPRAIKFTFTTFYLAALGVWLAGWLVSRQRVRLIVRAYLVAATVSAALGLAGFFLPIPGAASLTYGGSRAQAFFKDPNVFGSFCVIAALILAEELLRPSILHLGRVWKALLFLLLAVAVIFSFSRAAWVSLVTGLVVIALVHASRRGGGRRALTLLAAMIIAGAVAYAVLSAAGQVAFLQQRAHAQRYDSGRFGAQRLAIELAQRHPLGVGPGQFESYSFLSVHETYLRALVEIGVLGLVTIGSVLVVTLILALRNVVRGVDTFGLGSATLLAVWSALLVSGFVIDTLHWRHLWVTAALIWSGAARRPG
jgi:O-antigen ligase